MRANAHQQRAFIVEIAVMLSLFLSVSSCESYVRANITKRNPASKIDTKQSPASTIKLNPAGDPVSFALTGPSDPTARLTWESPPSGGEGALSQTLNIFAGNDADCQGTSALNISVASDATEYLWNRLSDGLAGVFRFRITSTDSKGQTAISKCSGTVALRSGLASYSIFVNFSTLFESESVFFYDINEDGFIDVIFPDKGYNGGRGAIVVMLGNANGVASRDVRIFVGSSTADQIGAMGLQLADFNGDTKLDITAKGFGAVGIIFGSASLAASGEIAAVGRLYTYPGFAGNYDIYDNLNKRQWYADLNGDGMQDLIANDWIVSTAYIILGAPDMAASGSFTTASSRTYTGNVGGGMGWPNTYIGDLTGDGKPELVMRGSSDCLYIVLGAATLAASGTVATQGRRYCGTPYVLPLFDIDRDGRSELIAYSSNSLYILPGAASLPASDNITSLTEVKTYSGSWGDGNGSYSVGLATLDVNNDTHKDLLLSDPHANGTLGRVAIFLSGSIPNSGTLTTAASRYYEGTDAGDRLYISVDIGDVNGDGVHDYGGNCSASNICNIMFGTATTLPASGPITGNGMRYSGIQNMYFANVTGDAATDIIATSQTGAGFVRIFRGGASLPASGDLSTTGTVFTGSYGTHAIANSVQFSDFNQDGLQDLIINHSKSAANPALVSPGEVCILAGQASYTSGGTLASAGKCFSGANDNELLYQSHNSDINNDGMPDLVLARAGITAAADVSVVMGRSDFTLMNRQIIASPLWNDSIPGDFSFFKLPLNATNVFDLAIFSANGVYLFDGRGLFVDP